MLVTLLTCSPCGSALARATSSLQILVIDGITKTPLPLVNVSIIGPTVRIGFTDEHGVAHFDNVPPGSYTVRLAKAKYKPSTLPNLTIAAAEDSAVTMSMSRILRTIGAVTVKATPRLGGSHIGTNSPERIASGSLASALGLNPFVDVSAGVGNAQNASIEGHSAGTTAVLVDGAPAAPLGSPANLRSLSTDLFDAVNISTDVTGSGGGALDFHIPDPTLAPSYSFAGSYGTYDRSRDAFLLRGTAGRLGYSVGDGTTGYNDVLNGKYYLDTSGLDYFHDASTIARTLTLKLRYPLAESNVLFGEILASNSLSADYCRQFSARVPCGYGPGNYTSESLRTVQVRDAATLGWTSLNVQLFATNEMVNDDQRKRFVNGLPSSLNAAFAARTDGVSISMSSPLGTGNSLNASILSEGTTYSGNAIAGTLSASMPSQRLAFGTADIGATVRFSPKTTVSLQGGLSTESGASSMPNGAVSIIWNPTVNDRVVGLYTAGNMQVPPIASNGISEPQSLEFECAAREAFGYGPGLTAHSGDSSTARLSWLHRFADAQVLVSLHRQVVHDDVIEAYENGSAFSSSFFPLNYFQTASALYASPLQCGEGRSLGPSDIYYLTPVAATTQYEGGSVLTKVPLGHALIAMPYYVTTVAKPTVVISPTSSRLGLIVGSQIPNVPLHKYGMTLDWKVPRSPLEAVLNITHVATNNANNLPAYTLFNAGALLQLQRGELIVSATNLFNQFAGLYVSPENAVAIITNSGASIPVLATPLNPRSFRVEYRVRIGKPESRPVSSGLESELGAPTSTTFALKPFPSEPPNDAFDIATDNPACGPESVGPAKKLLDALKAYVSANSFVDLKILPYGVNVRRHLTPAGYVLLIGGGEKRAMTALFACGIIHGGSDNDVRMHGLYIPTIDESRHYDLLFDPRVGLYVTNLFAPKPVHLTLRALPKAPPSNPFALTPGAACPSEVRGAAQLTLDSLKRYFSDVAPGQSRSSPQGITIVEHHDPNAWFEIRFEDPQLSIALLQCGMIAGGTLDEIRKFGVSGVRVPELGYAARLGLYVRSD